MVPFQCGHMWVLSLKGCRCVVNVSCPFSTSLAMWELSLYGPVTGYMVIYHTKNNTPCGALHYSTIFLKLIYAAYKWVKKVKDKLCVLAVGKSVNLILEKL